MSESEKPFKQEIDYPRYWKEQYEKEHKRCQELQGELSIVKATTVTNSPEMRDANKKILTLKLKIKELETRVEGLIDPVQKARESGL